MIADLAAAVTALRRHRNERIDQVRAALARLGVPPDPADETTIGAVVRSVYPELSGVLATAAGSTTRATLSFLAARSGD